MVSEAGLCKVAQELDLGPCLRLGKGEERSGGRSKPSLLADALEALIGAVYLDGGLEAARDFVLRCFDAHTPANPGMGTDHKTRLQELVQSQRKTTPEYWVVDESGPDHSKTFEVAVLVDGVELSRARGRSKKVAEQSAAELAVIAIAELRDD